MSPSDVGEFGIALPAIELDEEGPAKDEASVWVAEKYDAASKAKMEVARRVHKLASYLIPLGILFAFMATVTMASVYILHLILPPASRWLDQSQVQQVHDLLFSAIAGAAISGMTKAYFRSEPPKD